jgi:CheY-like chemotaxis protein
MTHILLVEDDENIAILMRRLIEKHIGCRVTVTASPDEVMDLLDRDPVTAIVMDVWLKDARLDGVLCNGVELTRRIRQHPRHHAIPILLATAHAIPGQAEQFLAESGANAYVSKPFVGSQALIEPLRRLLAA